MDDKEDTDEEEVLMRLVVEEQRKHNRRIFDDCDVTGEGVIMTSQLKEALRGCAMIPTESWLQEHINAFSENGKITWEKFEKITQQYLKAKKVDADLIEAFRRFDPDITGFVTCAEMRKVLTSLGDALSEDEIQEFLSDADPLKRGNINYTAFTQILINGPQ